MTDPRLSGESAVIGRGEDIDGAPCAMGREWSGPGLPACPEPAPIRVTFRNRPGEAWRLCQPHADAIYQHAMTMTDEEWNE